MMSDWPVRTELRRLRIEMTIFNDAVAETAGLNPRDLDVLDVIDREGPCTPSHLAERTGTRRATLTSVLSRLHRDGWITRTPNPTDSRSATLTSTDRFDELRTLYTHADRLEARFQRQFTIEQQHTIASALSYIADYLRLGDE